MSSLHAPSVPGQNGPVSEGGSAANSPSMSGLNGQAPGPLALEDKESREQDRLLPIANISRIMKKVLPDHAKMSKEAKAALQECVSEFIGFITSEASDRLMEEKRKTITGDDIIDSMRALGFDSYMEFLQSYLKKYRQSNKAKVAAEKPQTGAAGAHKRGRKARGDDDDEPDHSASPVNLPSSDHSVYSTNASMLHAQHAHHQQQHAMLAQQMAHLQQQQHHQLQQQQHHAAAAEEHGTKRRKA